MMKKVMLVVYITVLTGVTVAIAADLLAEFNRRDSIKLTPQMGAALSYLKAKKYNVQDIVKFEIVDAAGGTFTIQDRNGDVCEGNFLKSTLSCQKAAAPLPTDNGAPAVLDNEAHMIGVGFFLESVNYDISTIREIEMIDADKGTFVFRDNKGTICLGDYIESVLRCKNEIGITGVSYKGDSD